MASYMDIRTEHFNNRWPRVYDLCLGTYFGGPKLFKKLDFINILRNNYKKFKFNFFFALLWFLAMYSHGYWAFKNRPSPKWKIPWPNYGDFYICPSRKLLTKFFLNIAWTPNVLIFNFILLPIFSPIFRVIPNIFFYLMGHSWGLVE